VANHIEKKMVGYKVRESESLIGIEKDRLKKSLAKISIVSIILFIPFIFLFKHIVPTLAQIEGFNQTNKTEQNITGVTQLIKENVTANETQLSGENVTQELIVSFGRRLDCQRCGQHKAPPLTDVNMTITATVSNPVSGILIDYYPIDWLVTDANGGSVDSFNSSYNKIEWDVEGADSINKWYLIRSPALTKPPTKYYFFSELAGKQSDLWFVTVSDPPGAGLIVFWDGGNLDSLPAGWRCISCQGGDTFYQKFVNASDTFGTNGGSDSHAHTATRSASTGPSSPYTVSGSKSPAVPTNTHTHVGGSVTFDTASNLPPYRNLVVIIFDGGIPSTLPTGAIALFNESVPTGWTRYTELDNNFIRGDVNDTVNQTGGIATHSHTISDSLPATGDAGVTNNNAPNLGSDPAHTHSVSTSTGTGSNSPPYITVVFGKINSAGSIPDKMIALFNETPPSADWEVVSNIDQPFFNKFLNGSDTYGTTGGATTHTHADLVGVQSGEASTKNKGGAADAALATDVHTHNVDYTSFNTSSNVPAYATAILAYKKPSAAVDCTFNIAFPSTYSSSFNETASNTTTANWISFNFTSNQAENWTQPWTNGVSTNNQDGSLKPIYLIYNTGNTNIEFTINASIPSNFQMCANSTCAGGDCSGNPTACTSLSSSFVSLGTLNQGKQLNVTLYANKTAGISPGESSGNTIIVSQPG